MKGVLLLDWISIEDRLPDKYENNNEYDITNIVTHWMPLPEPPRMEEV